MPKATLTFNLDDPEDKHSFYMATHGQRFYNALWEIRNELRKIEKYSEEPNDKFTSDKFYELVQDEEIILDRDH